MTCIIATDKQTQAQTTPNIIMLGLGEKLHRQFCSEYVAFAGIALYFFPLLRV